MRTHLQHSLAISDHEDHDLQLMKLLPHFYLPNITKFSLLANSIRTIWGKEFWERVPSLAKFAQYKKMTAYFPCSNPIRFKSCVTAIKS